MRERSCSDHGICRERFQKVCSRAEGNKPLDRDMPSSVAQAKTHISSARSRDMFKFEMLSALLIMCLLNAALLAQANEEGNALNALKLALVDPTNALESWDPALYTPCSWIHLTCSNDNSVIRIDLGDMSLSGTLVPELGNLTNLTYLELYTNNITGGIPAELGKLKKLVSLDLYDNDLTGPIPDSLVGLQNLSFLRLQENSLTGVVPAGLTSIPSLQVFNVSNNNLTESAPSPQTPASVTDLL